MSIISTTLGAAGRGVKRAATATAEVPAPALAMSAIGLFGLVDWPVVVAVSGSAFVLQRVRRTSDQSASSTPPAASRPRQASKKAPAKSTRRPAGTA